MLYKLMPRKIEEKYNDCLLEGKSPEECIKVIQPYIEEYPDQEGVKHMIQVYHKQRKAYEAQRKRNLTLLAETKDRLRR